MIHSYRKLFNVSLASNEPKFFSLQCAFPINIYPWTQGDKEEMGRGNFSNIKISATSTDSSYLTVMGIPI